MNVHKYSMSHNQSNVREIIKMLVILGPYSIQKNVVSRRTRNTNLSPLQLHNEVTQTKKLEPIGIKKSFKYSSDESFFKHIETSIQSFSILMARRSKHYSLVQGFEDM